MYKTVGNWLKVELSPEEEVTRLRELETVLANYGFKGDEFFVLKSYEDHKKSGIYPYSGGRGEQPQWVLDDFDTLSLLEEREYLRKKHGTAAQTGMATAAATPAPLPKFKDMQNRKG